MKQLMHVKVSGASYFIDSENVIYAGADGVKWICRGMITELSGYPEGLASFKEPDFLKVGGKMVNRARIITYTNSGVAVETTQQYFETINYSNDNEYDRLKMYFDPSDSTEIDGYHLVKDKFCSFEPNGMSGALINGQSVTPIKPKPEEVAILTIQSLVDENYIPVSSISGEGTYRLMIKVEGANDPVSYVRDTLSIKSYLNSGYERTVNFAVYDHHTETEDIMVEMWLYAADIEGGGTLKITNTVDETVLAEYQIAQPQPGFNITSAYWDDDSAYRNHFVINVDKNGEFASALRQRLYTTGPGQSSYSDIRNIDQVNYRTYMVSLNDYSSIVGEIQLWDTKTMAMLTSHVFEAPQPEPQTVTITEVSNYLWSYQGWRVRIEEPITPENLQILRNNLSLTEVDQYHTVMAGISSVDEPDSDGWIYIGLYKMSNNWQGHIKLRFNDEDLAEMNFEKFYESVSMSYFSPTFSTNDDTFTILPDQSVLSPYTLNDWIDMAGEWPYYMGCGEVMTGKQPDGIGATLSGKGEIFLHLIFDKAPQKGDTFILSLMNREIGRAQY